MIIFTRGRPSTKYRERDASSRKCKNLLWRRRYARSGRARRPGAGRAATSEVLRQHIVNLTLLLTPSEKKLVFKLNIVASATQSQFEVVGKTMLHRYAGESQ